MDKWQGLQSFWGSFGISAYDENTVPSTATLPYITYAGTAGDFEQPVLCTGSIWMRSKSWKDISQLETEIKRSLEGGRKIALDNHQYLWIYPGTPFSMRMRDEDPGIRRVLINVNIEYLTID